MKSAAQLIESEVPDVPYIWGDLLRHRGRISVIGAPKTAKSFFVMQLALHIATGTPFLGMETQPGVVLYVNFEISEEKLQERIQDQCSELGIQAPGNLLLESPGGLALDKPAGKSELEKIIAEANAKCGQVDVLIIDPRRQCMGGDENQSEVLTAWNNNLDEVASRQGIGSVIVHHTGKKTTGAGRGSSVFDGWLDTIMWLKKPPNRNKATLELQGRDSEQRTLHLEFNYPLWKLTDVQASAESSKVGKAAEFIVGALGASAEQPYDQLRRGSMKARHTDYAFKTAVARLRDAGKMVLDPDKTRAGNWKIARLVSQPDASDRQAGTTVGDG